MQRGASNWRIQAHVLRLNALVHATPKTRSKITAGMGDVTIIGITFGINLEETK